MALQFPQLQTSLARKAVSALGTNINGEIGIGRISIVFFNKVMAYDTYIAGGPEDTLASFRKLSVTVSPKDLLRGELTVQRLFLEDGVFNLRTEGPGRMSNLNRILSLQPKPDSLKKPPVIPDMNVHELILRDMRFNLRNMVKDSSDAADPGRFNYSNMSLSGIDARINRISVKDNTVSCRIRDLSASDHSGYILQSLAGNFSLDSCETRIDNLHLIDSYSEINAEYLSFGYRSGKDLNDFIHKIRLGADFDHSTLDFRSLGYFAPGLRNNKLRLYISGEVTGPVCRLRTDGLTVSVSDSTSVTLRAAVTGLPEIDSTIFEIDTVHISATTSGLAGVMNSINGSQSKIGSYIPGIPVSFDGSAHGTLSSLHSSGTLSSDVGGISYTARMTRENGRTGLDAAVKAEDVDLGIILDKDILGQADISTGFSAAFGTGEEGLTASLDSLTISRLTVKGHDYRGIAVTGRIQDNTADIRLVSHDRAFPAMFQSIVTLDSTERPDRIRVFLDVPYADLRTMNLVNKGDMSNLGITASADLRFTTGSILGSILLDNISYANDNGQYHIDSLYIRSAIMENRNIVTVLSPVFHIDYSSTDSPSRLVERLKLAARGRALSGVLPVDTAVTNGKNGHYDLHLRTFDMSQICDIILPGLHIADSTTLDFRLDSCNALTVNARSSAVSFNTSSGKEYSITDIGLYAGNADSITSGAVSVGRLSSGGLTADNIRMNVREKDSTMLFGLTFNNADTTYLDFSAGVRFNDTGRSGKTAGIKVDSSELMIRGHRWRISPAHVTLARKNYAVDGLSINGDNDSLRVSGTISEDRDSKLSLTIDNLDLSVLNSFMKKDLALGGRLTGELDLYNFFSGTGATMEIYGEDLSLLGNNLGRITAMSRRDMARNRFNILINNYVDSLNPVNLSGYYIPGRNYMNLNLGLNNLSLHYLSPILSDFVNITEGGLSGDITITGQPDRILLGSSNCHIDSLYLTPVFTQVPYIINGPVSLNQRSIEFHNLSITDNSGSKATLNGNITHDSFRNIYLDTRLDFNNFMCLNTNERDNGKFYGTAFATGNVSLSGYTDNLLIDAQLATDDNSAIHIPLSSSSSATTTDLISYTDFRSGTLLDSTAAAQTPDESVQKTKNSNIEVRARASVTQGTELLIEMNKQLGSILRCTGDGDIDLTFNPARNITDLRGDYTIADGSYHLALSIQSRDFTIDEGGTIAFNGDLKNTSLNVGATYSTKASISTLISDTTSVGNRRNVNCGIQLQGSLDNPELSFTIDIPDLDPITKGRVESALSTPEKVQKQFMALLISGSFVPDEQSGIVNNSTILYSNASEILSNQFNNIFRQLDIPLDLGLNYQPGTATGGKDMFDVAISYQAFNNRLIINGNVGNSETSSNWAGDFDAEIKVDRQGKLRITLFTRSADSYSNYLDNTQRSGFGITYQDEFDTFGDFWRNIFYSRKRKEQYELELMREAEEELEREAAEANIVKEEIQRPREDPLNFMEEETGYTEYRPE